MKLIVGLDVSSTELDACFLTDDDRFPLLKGARFDNDQMGATQIHANQRNHFTLCE